MEQKKKKKEEKKVYNRKDNDKKSSHLIGTANIQQQMTLVMLCINGFCPTPISGGEIKSNIVKQPCF